MKTVISTYYIEKINELAFDFATTRSQSFPIKYQRKVFNSTYQVYKNISLFLYLKLYKTSVNTTSFKFNHIFCKELKKFSCKLYYKIISDLANNNVIAINKHYFHGNPEISFSKSYLIHKDIFHKINQNKQKFQYSLTQIDIPIKVLNLLNVKNVNEYNEELCLNQKLNRFNREEPLKKNSPILNFYNQLKYDEKQLDDFCENDDILYNFNKRKLLKLNQQPKLIKGRLYHPFHEFSKKFRESVLMFENEHIKEIFDISGSDLHMLAKHLENVIDIPKDELINFQIDVKNDFRRKFGIKKNGKCKANVKTAFKVYLNLKKDKYDKFRKGSIASRIDEYFKIRYPSIREYIINTDDIWQIAMNEEYDVMSNKMVEELYRQGIKSFTCHDAIYVKESVNVPNIKKLFYQKLDFISDRTI